MKRACSNPDQSANPYHSIERFVSHKSAHDFFRGPEICDISVNLWSFFKTGGSICDWLRTVRDRLTWRWHAEAFTQPRDTMVAQ